MSHLHHKLGRGQTNSEATEALIGSSRDNRSNNTSDFVFEHEQLRPGGSRPANINDIEQGIDDPDIGQGKSERYLLPNEIRALKTLEETRSRIGNEETNLDRKLDDIDMLMLNSITVFILMVSGGSLSGVVIKEATTFYLLIAMLVLTFGLGVGVTFFLGYVKVRKLEWQCNEITVVRGRLSGEVDALMRLLGPRYGLEMAPGDGEVITVSSASLRLTVIQNSLDPASGNYLKDHAIFLSLSCAACCLYLVLLALVVYFIHASDAKVTTWKVASPNMLLLYVWLCYLPAYSFAFACLLRGLLRGVMRRSTS